MAAAPGAGAPGNAAGAVPRVMSRTELVRLWEDLFDKNPEAAEELFFDSLLRDARAEYGRRARKEEEGKDGDEEERRRARVSRPWEPPTPGGSAMPPPLQPVAAPVTQPVVLALCAPRRPEGGGGRGREGAAARARLPAVGAASAQRLGDAAVSASGGGGGGAG